MAVKKKTEKLKKVRVGIYIPEHQAYLAEQAFGSKSAFVTAAIKYYVESGGLRRRFKELLKEVE